MLSYTFSGEPDESVSADVNKLFVSPSVRILPHFLCNDYDRLKEVNLSEGLMTIGAAAFLRCISLSRISIPTSARTIEHHAFANCAALEEVKLPDGLENIGTGAFMYCKSLSRIKFPSSVERIEDSAFRNCSALTEVDLSNGLKEIGEFALYSCNSLTRIRIPTTVERIEDAAFERCTALENVDWQEGITSVGEAAFRGCTNIERIAIPSTLVELMCRTFRKCSSLVNVRLPEGLKEINEGAFGYCPFLAAISLPDSLMRIWGGAFKHCGGLVTVEISATCPVEIWDGAFQHCKSLTNICVATSTMGNRSTIDDSCFEGCTLLHKRLGIRNLGQALIDRFEVYPVHKLCYYVSATTTEDLRWVVDDSSAQRTSQTSVHQCDVDAFGMTAFHVLLSAAIPRKDLLQVLLDMYSPQALDWKDANGKRPIDYLWNKLIDEWKCIIQTVLQKSMIDCFNFWGCETWKSEMRTRVEALLSAVSKETRVAMYTDAYASMGMYKRREATSLLELALWKYELRSGRKGSKRVALDRGVRRAVCGAAVVIPNVICFLKNVGAS